MHPLKTYLVEDSPLIRDNLIAMLEELTPVVVLGSAEDEASAVEWLGQTGHRVDLVIVDIFLKSGTGLGVLERVGALRTGAKLVVLSNYATSDIRRRCLDLGADEVFDKSSDIDALIHYCGRMAGDGPAGPRPVTLN
jgi:DNA-binding NarL/FixJ family response regulator